MVRVTGAVVTAGNAPNGVAVDQATDTVYVENIGEDQLDRLRHTDVSSEGAKPLANRANTEQTIISGKLEAEMSELPSEELKTFLSDYGLAESGTERLIRTTYRLLGLISFFTVGEEECRAWTITRGTNAQSRPSVHPSASCRRADQCRHRIRCLRR